jgi:hypothetical protein
MPEFDDIEIGKLLRLKKFEQPPPAYFENFLHEFHRRQRDELLRQPLWRLGLERAQDFMFRLNFPSLASYPVAAAAVLVCAAVLSLKVYQTPDQITVASPAGSSFVASANSESAWNLATPVATRDFSFPRSRNMKESVHTHRAAAPPRYVLDSIPVSYEPAFRF